VTVGRSRPGAAIDVSGLQRRLTGLVEGHPVTLVPVDVIPATSGGKHRRVVSQHAGEGLAPPRDPAPAVELAS
jgi:hypothetical protein